ARRGFDEVRRLDPVNLDAFAAEALLESEGGDAELARSRAMSVLDLVQGRAPSYVAQSDELARAVRQLEHDAARRPFDDAVQARPFDVDARAARGFHLLENGAETEGREDLEAALFLGAQGELKARIEGKLRP